MQGRFCNYQLLKLVLYKNGRQTDHIGAVCRFLPPTAQALLI